MKIPFIASLRKSFLKEELSSSQKQPVIRLIDKKDQRLKKSLPFLISANQSPYGDEPFISECGRLISDLLQISDTLKLDGLLAAKDIQKAFNSVNHTFLVSTLERYGFGNRFVRWVKFLLKNQESCIINGGNTIL